MITGCGDDGVEHSPVDLSPAPDPSLLPASRLVYDLERPSLVIKSVAFVPDKS